MSSLVPHLGGCVDDIAFFPSMISKSNVHGPATFMQNTGFILPGYPSMGAWISYGLGGMNDNLPTFVVLPDPRGFAPNGPANHSAAFLPAAHQGTMIRVGRPNPIHDLFPPKSAKYITAESEEDVARRAREAQPRPHGRARRGLAARSAYSLLRNGRAAAGERARSAGRFPMSPPRPASSMASTRGSRPTSDGAA